ncbi:DUF3800 domain-containing protein [Ferrovibrio sp.]|uniref:DUF3800 domain-containing protein n=1 Tax=Ferrovibrio sp. TaxID=1917215 RepID=UPI0035B33A4E
MSWLFFMDESGHDHKNMPLEVRGGVTLHTKKLWSFIQGWQRLEQDAFGVNLRDFGKEAKGYKLLDRDRIKWAKQTSAMPNADRRKYARTFLQKGRDKAQPTSTEFAAYGQACIEMARGVFDLLSASEAILFAAAIPRGVKRPEQQRDVDFLRKDHVFLFERFFYFLEAKAEHGLIVMDESEKNLDKAFVSRIEAYFTRTATGRNRTQWIIPAPLFVSSDMTYAVQAADISLYAINWGFRRQNFGTTLETREEIAAEYGPKLSRLEWEGDGYRDGRVFRTHGFVYVPDPYEK